MSNEILEFGKLVPGVHYVFRPGGYAVICHPQNKIAVLQTPQGWFLPGGGQNGKETAEKAAIRESLEECGLRIRLIELIGIVDQLVFAADEAIYFRKRCTFFLAEQSRKQLDRVEVDHELFWLTPDDAINRFSHESQRWAVSEYLACNRKT